MSVFREYLKQASISESYKITLPEVSNGKVTVYDNEKELSKSVSKKGLKELKKAEEILKLPNPTKDQLWDVWGTIFNGALITHWDVWCKHMGVSYRRV